MALQTQHCEHVLPLGSFVDHGIKLDNIDFKNIAKRNPETDAIRELALSFDKYFLVIDVKNEVPFNLTA